MCRQTKEEKHAGLQNNCILCCTLSNEKVFELFIFPVFVAFSRLQNDNCFAVNMDSTEQLVCNSVLSPVHSH